MSEESAAAFAKYYRLKAQYEGKIAKQRRAITGDPTLSRADKQRRLAAIVARCASCKKPGGMRFERKGPTLVASCAASPPCRFSLTVERGNYADLRTVEEGVAEEVKRLEGDVIRTKLDLLFGYSSQADTVAHFERIRPHLRALMDRLADLRREYWKVVTRVGEKKALRRAEGELALARERLAELTSEGEGDDASARKGAAVYVDTIRPLVERIRGLRYERSAVEREPNQGDDVLVLAPYTLGQLIVAAPGPVE
jgi:hypothetical protein